MTLTSEEEEHCGNKQLRPSSSAGQDKTCVTSLRCWNLILKSEPAIEEDLMSFILTHSP